MAGKGGFQLDHAGVEQILNSQPVVDLINGLAADVAAKTRGIVGSDVPVEVDTYTSDRHVASVAIKHPNGKGMQLRRGALTRAAGMVGLEVKPR